MTRDIHTLIVWIRVVAIVASTCATSLPVVYAILFPWHKRPVGRLIMLLCVTYAVTIDLSTLFSFWKPSDILWIFWIDAIVLTAISVASLLLVIFMLRLRFPSKKGKKNAAER